jgi:hypothetical protein
MLFKKNYHNTSNYQRLYIYINRERARERTAKESGTRQGKCDCGQEGRVPRRRRSPVNRKSGQGLGLRA